MSAKKDGEQFDQTELTHRAAHYLMAIQDLRQEHGYARLTDLAKKLKITPGSCSVSIKALKAKGLVDEDHNRFLLLSVEGKRLVAVVKHTAEQLRIFFKEFLGVKEDLADEDACRVEHLLSVETSLKLCRFIHELKKKEECLNDVIKTLQTGKPTCSKYPDDCNICEAYELCEEK